MYGQMCNIYNSLPTNRSDIKLWNMRFLSNVLSTLLGIFLFFIICFFGILIMVALVGNKPDVVQVKDNSVIELDLKQISLDYEGKFTDPIMALLGDGEKVGFTEIIDAIEAAKEDNKIKGISLVNSGFDNLGMAQLKALRNALEDFKESGKFITSYGDIFTQSQYYLKSVSDTIFMNPIGMLEFKGLGSEILYLKDLQEKSGVQFEVIRHGKYKSAVEPFLDNKMSDENREQITELLVSVWNTMTQDISESRKISIDSLDYIANHWSARTAEMAIDSRLVDKIAYEDEYHASLKNHLGVKEDKNYEKVDLIEYARKVKNTPVKGSAKVKDRIAVIYAQGEIMGGEGKVNIIGEGAIRKAIIKARKDKNVKAIVLRVDSPGGNALTAELIWRELENTKGVKPIVVSMGNYAASGGYYIACNADKIIAEPTTITGSIGVFGLLPNARQLTNRMGIYSQQVSTHELSIEYSPFQPLHPKTKDMIQESIEQVYTTFITRVANGRNMTLEQVNEVGQGRVWTGTQALELGLVDQIGGLHDAIKEAAKLAEIEKFRINSMPEYEESFKDFLGSNPFIKSKEQWIAEEFGAEGKQILHYYKMMQNRTGVQAALPYYLVIR